MKFLKNVQVIVSNFLLKINLIECQRNEFNEKRRVCDFQHVCNIFTNQNENVTWEGNGYHDEGYLFNRGEGQANFQRPHPPFPWPEGKKLVGKTCRKFDVQQNYRAVSNVKSILEDE